MNRARNGATEVLREARRGLPVSARLRTLGVGIPGRPELYTSYEEDQAIFNTPAKKIWFSILMVGLLILPFFLSREMNLRMSVVFAAAIGAIGLNIVSGYAGQISLGHAFFIGLGAYTGAVISGDPEGRALGLGIENMLIWLPLAGLLPAVVGFVVAPVAVRVRGLYLAIVPLGLVFLGEHLFREMRFITGGAGVGRSGPVPALFGFRFDRSGEILGVMFTREQRFYFLCLLLLVVFALLTNNLAGSGIGRAFAAVRDRDIAAEVMGVPLTRTKVLAFTVSSFYAGICGGLFAVAVRQIEPANFGLLLSVNFPLALLILPYGQTSRGEERRAQERPTSSMPRSDELRAEIPRIASILLHQDPTPVHLRSTIPLARRPEDRIGEDVHEREGLKAKFSALDFHAGFRGIGVLLRKARIGHRETDATATVRLKIVEIRGAKA
jgi:branched-chain amino acid transport system permease protein